MWALKDTTTLWAAATSIFLVMPLNATAAQILVPAAAFGGPHAEGWPALPLHLQVTSPFLHLLGAYMGLDDDVLAHAYGEVGDSAACVLSGRAFFGACVCAVV